MKKRMIKLSMFVFYFLFFISYFENSSLGVLKYASIGFISCVFLLTLVSRTQDKINKRNVRIIVTINFILYLTLAIMLFFSEYKSVSIIKYFSLIYLFFLTFSIMPRLIKAIGIRTNNSLVILSIALAILIAFIISPHGMADSGGARAGMNFRLKLFFNTPNTLGAMCFLGLLLIIYNFYKQAFKRIITKLFFAGLGVAFVYLLIQTDTRTSMYALIVFLGLFIYKAKSKNKYFKVAGRFYIVGVLLLLSIYVFQNYTFKELDAILSFRLQLWKFALNQLLENQSILTGQGSYLNSQIKSLNIGVLDNGYVYMIYQNGLFSLLVLLLLLITLYRFLNKSIINRKDKVFMTSYFFIFLFICLFENNLFNLSGLFCILSYSYVYYFLKYAEPSQDKASTSLSNT